MSQYGQRPSKAQERDCELAHVEAELKAAREKLDALNAEIRRSYRLLASLRSSDPDARTLPTQFDGVVPALPFLGRPDEEAPP